MLISFFLMAVLPMTCAEDPAMASRLRIEIAADPGGSRAPGEMLRDLTGCAGSLDPAVRDGLGYTGIARILRSEPPDSAVLRPVAADLIDALEAGVPDPDGVTVSFLSLYLSEFLRADRIEPYLSAERLGQAARLVAALIRDTEDYRGFEPDIGWRHRIAHLSDAALQLGLNDRLPPEAKRTLLDALLGKVAPRDHAYVHGEPGRIARAMIYLWAESQSRPAEIAGALQALADPGPAGSWDDAYQREVTLTRLHNVRAFLDELIVSLHRGDDPLAQAIVAEAHRVRGELP